MTRTLLFSGQILRKFPPEPIFNIQKCIWIHNPFHIQNIFPHSMFPMVTLTKSLGQLSQDHDQYDGCSFYHTLAIRHVGFILNVTFGDTGGDLAWQDPGADCDMLTDEGCDMLMDTSSGLISASGDDVLENDVSLPSRELMVWTGRETENRKFR